MTIFQALRQQKRRLLSQSSFFLAIHLLRKYMASNRQFPNLPGRLQPSTFGVYVLNYCVRYGNRWDHIAIATRFVSVHVHSKLYRNITLICHVFTK